MAVAGAVAAIEARRSRITGTHIPFVLEKNEEKTIEALKKAWAKVTDRSIIIGFSAGNEGYLIYERSAPKISSIFSSKGKEDVNYSVTLYRYPLNNLLEFDLYDGPYGDNFMFAYYFEQELQKQEALTGENKP